MRNIYRSTECVGVYLREETTSLDRAIDLFQTLHENSRIPISTSNTPADTRDSLLRISDEVCYRLHDFYRQSWFTRIWVVQDAANLTVDPVVLCGSFNLSWSAVVRVAGLLRDTALTSATQGGSPILNSCLIQQCRDKQMSFVLLLMSSFHFESTDPRDTVFALYGIIPFGR
jgi:hypothetical protein